MPPTWPVATIKRSGWTAMPKTLEYIKFEWLVNAFVFLQVRIHDTIRYILLMWINYVFSKQFENDCGMNNGFEEEYGLHFTRWYLQYVPCSAFAYFHFCCKWYRLYQCSRQDPRLKARTCYSPYRVRGSHILNRLKATLCAAYTSRIITTAWLKCHIYTCFVLSVCCLQWDIFVITTGWKEDWLCHWLSLYVAD